MGRMMHQPVRPTAEQLARLTRFERFAFELVDFVNSTPPVKDTSSAFLRTVGMSWVYYCTRKLIHLVGFDKLRQYHPQRGVILAVNHRSFFDLYVINCWLYRTSDLLQRTYFPVRSDFFYERPAGILVNLMMSALSMYPPVFRDPQKNGFNRYGLKRLAELLQQRGTVVGMHPEGHRGKGPDPYQLLPAQPGIGKLILEARPEVLPMFINGLGNDLPAQVRGNFDGQGAPVVIVAGQPLDLAAFFARRNTLRNQVDVAAHVMEEIRALGEVERALRGKLAGQRLAGPVVHS